MSTTTARDGQLEDVRVLVLAGGRGERLQPLTRDRTKGAVPFGGTYRLIDFTLSNCVNSGLRSISILPQYRFASLERHLRLSWDFLRPSLGEELALIPPQQRVNGGWYKGTADAVYQNIYALAQRTPSHVVVLSSDHVYRMDYRPLVERHASMGADLTMACTPVARGEARRFGVVSTDSMGRVESFREKPAEPEPMPGRRDQSLVSMGIYVFETRALIDRLVADATMDGSTHDFGRDVLPVMVARGDKVFSWDASRDKGYGHYWRDIGTTDAYWRACMDLLGRRPVFPLGNEDWPLYAPRQAFAPVVVAGGLGGVASSVSDSLLCQGAQIVGARVGRSIVSAGVVIGPDAEVIESVLMDGVKVGAGAVVKRAVIDKDSVIPPGSHVEAGTVTASPDCQVTEKGVLVVGRGVDLAARLSPSGARRVFRGDAEKVRPVCLLKQGPWGDHPGALVG